MLFTAPALTILALTAVGAAIAGLRGALVGFTIGWVVVFTIGWLVRRSQGGFIPGAVRREVVRTLISEDSELVAQCFPALHGPALAKAVDAAAEVLAAKAVSIATSVRQEDAFDFNNLALAVRQVSKDDREPSHHALYGRIHIELAAALSSGRQRVPAEMMALTLGLRIWDLDCSEMFGNAPNKGLLEDPEFRSKLFLLEAAAVHLACARALQPKQASVVMARFYAHHRGLISWLAKSETDQTHAKRTGDSRPGHRYDALEVMLVGMGATRPEIMQHIRRDAHLLPVSAESPDLLRLVDEAFKASDPPEPKAIIRAFELFYGPLKEPSFALGVSSVFMHVHTAALAELSQVKVVES